MEVSARLGTVILFFFLLSSLPASAGDATLAPTPPMGWNSWDSYGRRINETQFRATADWMAKHLRKYGWRYVVIDDGWYVFNVEEDSKDSKFLLDEHGRFIPVPTRFPSSANGAGFKAIADYFHSRGLKLGIHIIRGIPREAVAKNLSIADSPYHAADAADQSDACPWNTYNWGIKNNEAGQAYYDSIVKLYASWGVDFIKTDCIASHPYKPDEIRMLASAIKKSGRPIVLSLSPGPAAIENAGEIAKYAEMWRICDDFWDHWGPWPGQEWSTGLYQEFAITAKWARYVRPGSWPDADMLPLGHLGPSPGAGDPRDTKLTKDEQRTMMTLWSIFRSPLIMGGDLLSMDKWTTSLLTNPEVIAVDQHSAENRGVVNTENTAVWIARTGMFNDIPPEDYYLAVFNIGDSEQTVHYEWKDLGLSGASYKLRDLWRRKNSGKAAALSVKLAPHASVLYRLEGKR